MTFTAETILNHYYHYNFLSPSSALVIISILITQGWSQSMVAPTNREQSPVCQHHNHMSHMSPNRSFQQQKSSSPLWYQTFWKEAEGVKASFHTNTIIGCILFFDSDISGIHHQFCMIQSAIAISPHHQPWQSKTMRRSEGNRHWMGNLILEVQPHCATRESTQFHNYNNTFTISLCFKS